MTKERILSIFEMHGINCCVDIRDEWAKNEYTTVNISTFCESLRNSGIHYLSFEDEFGVMDARLCKRDSLLSYDKALKNVNIVRGLERLETGLSKNFNICLIDNVFPSFSSVSFAIVGRYFSEKGYGVNYVGMNGQVKDYNTLYQELESRRFDRSRKVAISHELGDLGEKFAALYLEEQGYEVLFHNWNLHTGCEIDIIAFKDNTLHFVEVKTRRHGSPEPPEYAVDRDKMINMLRAAKLFIRDNYMYRIPFKMDCVAVVVRSDTDYDIKFIKDINVQNVRFYT